MSFPGGITSSVLILSCVVSMFPARGSYAADATAERASQVELRRALRDLLGIPTEHCPLEPEQRGELVRGDVVIEKWVWTSEPGSRVPSVLYRPARSPGAMPAVVITCGHGGSKSAPYYTYMGQLYARLGVACLVLDPIGEEERHIKGRMGTRAHDPEAVHRRAG